LFSITACHKSLSGASGKKSSSPGSKDETLIRSSGFRQARGTVASKEAFFKDFVKTFPKTNSRTEIFKELRRAYS
jgi:hypothetical protein